MAVGIASSIGRTDGSLAVWGLCDHGANVPGRWVHWPAVLGEQCSVTCQHPEPSGVPDGVPPRLALGRSRGPEQVLAIVAKDDPVGLSRSVERGAVALGS